MYFDDAKILAWFNPSLNYVTKTELKHKSPKDGWYEKKEKRVKIVEQNAVRETIEASVGTGKIKEKGIFNRFNCGKCRHFFFTIGRINSSVKNCN